MGVTGEIAEFEAARALGLTLADVRQSGWDASQSFADGRTEYLQIKGRWMVNGYKGGAKLGRIDTKKTFDAVLLVLLDEDLSAAAIYRAERGQVIEALEKPGAKARNIKGQLSLAKFKSIGHRVWPPQREDRPASKIDHHELPWSISALRAQLSDPMFLMELCGPKRETEKRAVREHLLESQMETLSRRALAAGTVSRAPLLRDRLATVDGGFPMMCKPDLVAELDGKLHVCELKSSRIGYSRAKCVVGTDLKLFLWKSITLVRRRGRSNKT